MRTPAHRSIAALLALAGLSVAAPALASAGESYYAVDRAAADPALTEIRLPGEPFGSADPLAIDRAEVAPLSMELDTSNTRAVGIAMGVLGGADESEDDPLAWAKRSRTNRDNGRWSDLEQRVRGDEAFTPTDRQPLTPLSDEPEQPKPAGNTNFRGEEVDAVAVRYFENFENNTIGREWSNHGSIQDLEEFGRFLGPFRRANQTVNVNVTPGTAYVARFDIYYIGFPTDPADWRGRFEVVIDGVPVMSTPLSRLGQRNIDENEGAEDFDPRIHRQIEVVFTGIAPIAEIQFIGDTGAGFGSGSWGIDNVFIDEMENFGLAAFGDTTDDYEDFGHGAPVGPGVQRGAFRPFQASQRGLATRAGTGDRDRFDFQSFLNELLNDLENDMADDPETPFPEREEEPMEDPMDEDPDDDPTPDDEDEEVPSPGTGLVLGLGLAAMNRRRR